MSTQHTHTHTHTHTLKTALKYPFSSLLFSPFLLFYPFQQLVHRTNSLLNIFLYCLKSVSKSFSFYIFILFISSNVFCFVFVCVCVYSPCVFFSILTFVSELSGVRTLMSYCYTSSRVQMLLHVSLYLFVWCVCVCWGCVCLFRMDMRISCYDQSQRSAEFSVEVASHVLLISSC